MVAVGIEAVAVATTMVVPVEVGMVALGRVISRLLVTLDFLTAILAPVIPRLDLMELPATLKIRPK
jgi:hypothetical protein